MQHTQGQFSIEETDSSYLVTLNGERYAVTKSPKVMLGFELLRWVENALRRAPSPAATKS